MKERMSRDVVAMRVAKELKEGSYVNLGIGIPTLVSNYVTGDKLVIYQSESGILNCGSLADNGSEDVDLINAGGQFLKPVPGMAFLSSDEAFGMIRAGKIDVTVLGALQVSMNGDLANWMLPQRGVGNVGGAMDLAVAAQRVIVAMDHTDRQGNPKLVEQCTFPLTAEACVSLVVTDLAVVEIARKGFILKEMAPGWTFEEIQDLTEADLEAASDLKDVEL